jgi:hypothetical protein
MRFEYDLRHFLVALISGLAIGWVMDHFLFDGRIYTEISTTAPIVFRNAALRASNFIQWVVSLFWARQPG